MLGFDAMGRLALGQLEDHTRILRIEAGAFVVTGGAVQSQRLQAATGTFAVSGQSVSLRATRRLAIAAASFSLNGQVVGLQRQLRITAELGGFTFSGSEVDLSRFRPLVVGTGAFSLTGQSVSLRATRTMPAGAASFALSGSAVGTRATRQMAAGTGSFSVGGVAVRLLAQRRLAVSPLPATPAGTSASPGFVGFAALGEVALGQADTRANVTFMSRGQAVTLFRSKHFGVEAGVFVLTGGMVRLIQGNRPISVTIGQGAPSFRGRPQQDGLPGHITARIGSGSGFKGRSRAQAR